MTQFKSLLPGKTGIVNPPTGSDGVGGEGAAVRWNGLSSQNFIQYLAYTGIVNSVSKAWTAIANGATATFLIEVDSGSDSIFLFNFSAQGIWKVDLYEAPTVSAEGTVVNPHNLRRSNSNVVDSHFFYTPSTSQNGLLIYTSIIGTASGVKGNDEANYWMLKANTYYLVVLTNNSGGNADVSLNLITFADDLSMQSTSTSTSSSTSSVTTSSSSSSSISYTSSSSSSSTVSTSSSSKSTSSSSSSTISTSSSSSSLTTSSSSSSSSSTVSTSSSSISQTTT